MPLGCYGWQLANKDAIENVIKWELTKRTTARLLQTKGLQQLRLVMAVEAKYIEKFQSQLKHLVE
jgi:hypothetical protein